ncbi:MAG TPA: hypothetical protein VFK33_11585 [Bacillales bacterium]|nr:hypothetical protein [Bacillales bacterium]
MKDQKKVTDQHRAICVLGSGRCGTSAVTRSINLLGVEVGDNLISKAGPNPKGFWEDEKIVQVHQQLIRKFAKPLQPLPRGWIKKEKVKPYKEILTDYLKKNIANSDIWAFKDPRTALTLDLWIQIFDELDVLPHYLIMVRNPMDVIRSYKNSYNVNNKRSLYQWKLKTLSSLSKTRGERRLLIDYDHLIDDSAGTLRSISKAFHLSWPEDEAPFIQKLNSFIDPNLQHSRSSMKKLMKSNEYSKEIKDLYRLCNKASGSPDFLNSDEFHAQVNALLKATSLDKKV